MTSASIASTSRTIGRLTFPTSCPGSRAPGLRSISKQAILEQPAKPLGAWFPPGLDTPGLTLVKVHGETAEYWDAAASKVRQLLGLARAIRRNDPDEFPADNRTVEL